MAGRVTPRHAESPMQQPATRLRFDRYVLDLDRGCLLRDGNEIALRPKTFAVLHYLSENPARLVSKDELFAAVWPDLAVTDDTLVQSIGELRRALGDDGPRLIKTVPRRGYRFEAETSAVAAITEPPPDDAPVSMPSDEPTEGAVAINVRHALPAFLRPADVRARFKALGVLALALVLAAGVLWSGIAMEWSFSTGRSVDRSLEAAAKPAVAVLPFLNQGDDPARVYLADGLTQDIINALGRFSELTVLSWNAVLPYRDRPTSPGEIARKLAARYQVEGSVRLSGDRVRVNAQLVGADGRVLWSAPFDEARSDVFVLQDKLTTQVVGALAMRVSQIEQRRVFAKPTENLEAYDYVLRARPALQRPARAAIVEARALLRRAIELDPNYAIAYAALAETYFLATSMGWAESPTAFLARAQEMAEKALRIDDSEGRAHIILGRIHIFYHRYREATAEMERAIATNPNDAHGIAGRGNALMWQGQTDAAIEALEQAQRIDPDLSPMDRFALSLAYYLNRRYDAAIEQAELNLRAAADSPFSRIVLAAAYAEDNRPQDVARIVTMIRRDDPTFDAPEFGTKFLNSADLERLREGLRKAGLFPAEAGPRADR